MTQALTDAQRTFLAHYADMLAEVEKSVNYAGECYIKDDTDIGDRLLKNVVQALAAYNVENMTMDSIFSRDEEAVRELQSFQEAIAVALKVEEEFQDEGERIYFVHETLLPLLNAWRARVDQYRHEL